MKQTRLTDTHNGLTKTTMCVYCAHELEHIPTYQDGVLVAIRYTERVTVTPKGAYHPNCYRG